MVKIQLYITEVQDQVLEKEKELTGAKKAEIIRRALDHYFEQKNKERG